MASYSGFSVYNDLCRGICRVSAVRLQSRRVLVVGWCGSKIRVALANNRGFMRQPHGILPSSRATSLDQTKTFVGLGNFQGEGGNGGWLGVAQTLGTKRLGPRNELLSCEEGLSCRLQSLP